MISPIIYSTDKPMDNVMAQYKGKSSQEIRRELQPMRSELVNISLNFTNDFTKSSVIRTSNAFLASEVYVVGGRKFDRRGTVGLHHLENIIHATEFSELADHLIGQGYTIYPVGPTENDAPSVNLFDLQFPAKSAFLYGEETLPIGAEIVDLCNGPVISVQKNGSIRLPNTAQSAAILMSEYARQIG